MKPKVNVYTDYEAFYEANEPDSALEMRMLYDALSGLGDDDLYKLTEVTRGKITHIITASSGDQLLMTGKSKAAFLGNVWKEHRRREPELDPDEAADFEYALNNPHS